MIISPCHDTTAPIALFSVRMFFVESPWPFSRARAFRPCPFRFHFPSWCSRPHFRVFGYLHFWLRIVCYCITSRPAAFTWICCIKTHLLLSYYIFGKLFAPSLEPYVIPMYRTDFPMPSFLSLFNCVLVSLCISLHSTHFVQ